MGLPELLKEAPAWASSVFWVVVAVGAAFLAVRNFMAGAKTEAETIRKTGRPTPSEEIGVSGLPNYSALSVIGGAIAERQTATEQLEIGRSLVEEIEELKEAVREVSHAVKDSGMASALTRIASVMERRMILDEEAVQDRRIEQKAQELFDRHMQNQSGRAGGTARPQTTGSRPG